MADPLIHYKLRKLIGFFSIFNRADIIKRISFIGIIIIFFVGAGYFFFRMFYYLSTIEDIGDLLMARIIDNLLMVFFFMILFSNFITAVTTYFKSKELEFFFSSPLNPFNVFQLKYIETATYASWASLIVVVPMTFSFGIVQKSSILTFIVSFIAILLFAQIAAALGNIIALVPLKIFPKMSKNFSIAAIMLGALLVSLYFWLGKPAVFRVFEVQTEAELAQFVENLGRIGTIYLPSNWLSLFNRGIFAGNFDFVYFGLLTATSVALYLLLLEIGSKFYRTLYLQQRDFIGAGKKMLSRLFLTKIEGYYSILLKDIVLFFRNPTQWVQLLIFIVLMLIYIFSIFRTQFFFTAPFWRALIGFANFSYVSFLFATLGVRFIYPSISQEGQCFFLLKSSPIKLKTILLSKFIVYSIIAVIAGEILVMITNYFLVTDKVILNVSMGAVAIVILTVVSINLGIGSIFPDFNEQNPAKLAAGGGGVIAALICLAYTGFVIIIFARPTLNYLRFKGAAFPLTHFLFTVALFLIVSLTIMIFFLQTGMHRLEKVEW